MWATFSFRRLAAPQCPADLVGRAAIGQSPAAPPGTSLLALLTSLQGHEVCLLIGGHWRSGRLLQVAEPVMLVAGDGTVVAAPLGQVQAVEF